MYEEELVKKCNTIKKLWQYINLKIKGNKSNKNSHIDYINVNNKRIDDPLKISENFNNFFANIGHNIAKDITKKSEPEFNIVNNNSIFLTKIDKTEISKIIMSLNKASGVDKISAAVLKLIATYVTSPLTYVLNLCVDKGYWPISLKKSEIIPIFKGGDKHDMTNYRPISLISNIAKIFERLIYNRLVNFFEKNNILANNQFGFIGKRGTNDALIKVSEFIYENIDKSKPTLATFLDFKKAFDTVNHDILIHRLRSYGVRGLALDLIISYLNDRTQSVRLKNISSNNSKVTIGVPQGTILGPLFFIVYINELLKLLPQNLISYADDTVILYTGNTWNEVQNNMNASLDIVGDWLASNQLSLNVTKSVYMVFSTSKKNIPNNLNIKINGRILNSVNEYKYLGIIFESNMKWEKHLKNTTNRLRYTLFVINKLKYHLLPTTLISIYYALFHSVANYGIVAWGGTYKKYLSCINNLQIRLCKVINKYSDRRIINIHESYVVNTVTYYHKNLKSMYLDSTSITRNKSIILPKTYKRIGANRSYITAIKNFNKLPKNLKLIETSAKLLKNKIFRTLLHN